jgi:hypothetical protein
MGMTAGAHLVYGYNLGPQDDLEDMPEEFFEDPDDMLLKWAGFTEEWAPGKEGYFNRKAAAEDKVGVEFVSSGHVDYPGWLLIARGSRRSGYWEPFALDVGEISQPRPDWDAKLAAAFPALGLVLPEGGPHWLLYPSYG